MGCFVVCLFLARKCNASYWQSPVAGCVGPVLRKDVVLKDLLLLQQSIWCMPVCKEHGCVQSGQSPQCFAEVRSQGFWDVNKFGGLLLMQQRALLHNCYIK